MSDIKPEKPNGNKPTTSETPTPQEPQVQQSQEPQQVVGRIGIEESKTIGIRKQQQVKPIATGANLSSFQRFLVKIKLQTILSKIPGVPNTSKVSEATVIELVGSPSKVEPDLINGNIKKGIIGMNEQVIFKEQKTPFIFLFPKDKVSENEKLKATSEMLQVNQAGHSFLKEFLFLEYKGGPTLKEQIKAKNIELGNETEE